MSPQFLDDSAYRAFLAMPPNQGLNATTHTAVVADKDGKERNCYVKLLPDPNSPRLLCEALGWTLSGAARLLRPEFGAVVMIPIAKLPEKLRTRPELNDMRSCPAWCASAISPGRQVAHVRLNMTDLARERQSLLASKPARQIAAFDEWADVGDRNLGNVVVTPSKTFHPIDHETLLYDVLWTHQTLQRKSLLAVAEDKLDAEKLKRFKVDMCQAAKGHPAALAAAREALEEIIDAMFESPEKERKLAGVIGALEERSADGWLANKVGVLA